MKRYLPYLVLVLGVAAASPGGAFAASPAATTPADSPSAATPPAQPVSRKAGKVILESPSNVNGVFDGKVEFAAAAFPLTETCKETDVRTAMAVAAPAPCKMCRASGKITKKDTFLPPANGLTPSQPIVQTWVETCPDCG